MILTVCLNPAFQRTLWFRQCRINRVNRAIRKCYSVGGKGVNVARVIHQLQAQTQLLYPAGGGVGQDIETLLSEEKIPAYCIPTNTSTRICSTVIDLAQHTQTEMVEESEPVSSEVVQDFIDLFNEKIHIASVVVLSGSVPSGFDASIYRFCVDKANEAGIPVIVDASRALLLNTLPGRPLLIKPNCIEFMESAGLTTFSISNLRQGLRRLTQDGAQQILITCEDKPAWFFCDEQLYRVTFPKLNRVNPIGSGDAIAAGFAVGVLKQKPVLEALKLGMACGCANVLTETAGSIRLEDVQALLPKIEAEPIE